MSDTSARILETTGHSGTLVGVTAAMTLWLSDAVHWLNDNYMAVIAVCTIITTLVGAYGSLTRVRLAKAQRRREADRDRDREKAAHPESESADSNNKGDGI